MKIEIKDDGLWQEDNDLICVSVEGQSYRLPNFFDGWHVVSINFPGPEIPTNLESVTLELVKDLVRSS